MLVECLTNPVVAPKRRKRRRRPRPASCLRRFRCYHCGAYVNVCAPCDRGQRYCSTSCRDTARSAAVRVAGIIYQRSERGREKHAARQRAYWARRRAKQLSDEPPAAPPAPGLFVGAINVNAMLFVRIDPTICKRPAVTAMAPPSAAPVREAPPLLDNRLSPPRA